MSKLLPSLHHHSMSTQNRYFPLVPDELVPPLPPSPNSGHQVIEFEERPVTPVHELGPSLPVGKAVPSIQDEQQGSIHEVIIIF